MRNRSVRPTPQFVIQNRHRPARLADRRTESATGRATICRNGNASSPELGSFNRVFSFPGLTLFSALTGKLESLYCARYRTRPTCRTTDGQKCVPKREFNDGFGEGHYWNLSLMKAFISANEISCDELPLRA
jgi:hypothetical protein